MFPGVSPSSQNAVIHFLVMKVQLTDRRVSMLVRLSYFLFINRRIHGNATHRFVFFCFEAANLDFGHCHFVFLEPEVTIFGRKGETELVVAQYHMILSLLS